MYDLCIFFFIFCITKACWLTIAAFISANSGIFWNFFPIRWEYNWSRWAGSRAASSSRGAKSCDFLAQTSGCGAAGALAGVPGRGRGRDLSLGAVCSMGTLEIGLGCKDNAMTGKAVIFWFQNFQIKFLQTWYLL